MKILIYKTALLTCLFISMALASMAQLDPFQSMYYQNRYLLNPAMAGLDGGFTINTNYQQQWSSFPGTPKTGLLTGDYAATEKVGLGLNISDDESGIIRTTRVVGSYAYHLPLSETNSSKLNFGLSLGVNNSRVDMNKVSGDLSDNEIAIYNALKPYIDGDLGIAYTSNNLMVSATMPNLSATLLNVSDSRYDADQLLFIGAVSYKIPVVGDDNHFSFEPLAAYRIVKGYNNIFDAGVNMSVLNAGFNMQAIYHTNQSMSLGAGFTVNPITIMFNYNIETGPISNYTNGAFEVGIKLHVL